MRARRICFFVLLVLCAHASAQARKHVNADAVPRQALSAAAVRIAAPFGIVTSTFRTVEHNRAVGGVEDSYHLLGQAIDIVRRRGVSHAQIAAAFTAAGLHLIESLDEGNHSHFAFGPAVRKIRSGITLSQQHAVATQPRPRILLAADEHGVLRFDLPATSSAGRTKSQAGGTGRTVAH